MKHGRAAAAGLMATIGCAAAMPAGIRSADASLLEGKPLGMLAPYIGD